MTGKALVIIIGALALVTAAGVYYLQVFHYYDRVDPAGFTLAGPDGGIPARAANIEAIDAISSPIRFRACFDTTLAPDTAAIRYEDAVPLNAPFWFDCFDAESLGEKLRDGTATAFLGTKNIAYGADRVVAITEDGRGYVWHQLNDCGALAYDGTRIGEECPPRQTR